MGGLWRSGHKPWLFIGFDSLFSTRAFGLWGVMRTSWVCLVPLSPQPCLLEYGWECGTQGGGSWWSLGCQQGWLLRLWKHKADYCVGVQIRNLVPWVNQFALLPWRPLSWFRPIPPTFYRNSLGDSKVIFTNERWCKMMHVDGKYGWFSCDTAPQNDLSKNSGRKGREWALWGSISLSQFIRSYTILS